MGKPEGSCWLCPTQIYVLVTGIWHTFCVQSAKFLSSNLSRDISMRVCREFWHTTYTKNVRPSQFESEDAHQWRNPLTVRRRGFHPRNLVSTTSSATIWPHGVIVARMVLSHQTSEHNRVRLPFNISRERSNI